MKLKLAWRFRLPPFPFDRGLKPLLFCRHEMPRFSPKPSRSAASVEGVAPLIILLAVAASAHVVACR